MAGRPQQCVEYPGRARAMGNIPPGLHGRRRLGGQGIYMDQVSTILASALLRPVSCLLRTPPGPGERILSSLGAPVHLI